VYWTPTALQDLVSILEHLAAENPAAASAATMRLQARAESLLTLTPRGRIVPELREIGVNQYRELIERPWRLIYTVDAGRIAVVAVLDSRRDLQTLLLERLIRS
jgi:plasmid stabilization system protein ParE